MAQFRYIVRATPHNKPPREWVFFNADEAIDAFEEIKRQAHKTFCENEGNAPATDVDIYKEQNR